MTDGYGAPHILLRVSLHWKLPNVEPHVPAAYHDSPFAVDIRVLIARLPERQLLQILARWRDRPQMHGRKIEHGAPTGRAVDQAGAIGDPSESRDRKSVG